MPEPKDGKTTIGSGILKKCHEPTVIGSPVDTHVPTVISEEGRGGGIPGKLSMKRGITIVSSEQTKGDAHKRTLIVDRHAPSVIPGEARKFLCVDVVELEQCVPGYAEQAYEQAARVLSGIIVQAVSYAEAMEWGEKEILRYEALSRRSLEVVMAPEVTDASQYCTRVYEIVREIAKSFHSAPAQLFPWKNVPPKPQYVLREVSEEVEQVRLLLKGIVPKLREAHSQMVQCIAEGEDISHSSRVREVAAKYLATVCLRENIAECFTDRARILLRISEEMESAQEVRRGYIRLIEKLIRRVEEGVFVQLGQWWTQAMSWLSHGSNPTQDYAVESALESLLRNLK